jgi:two-component system sensor histidine kinase BaeS
MAAERQVSATFFNERPVPPVRADEERVRWIVNNLVENALRYTPAGGSVRVWLEQLGDRVLLKVSDTGIGIRPEDRANIFSRFYRGENARAKESAGNGLGLYIARNIAKDHGGDLNFADNPSGQGTTFTLSLPLARG